MITVKKFIVSDPRATGSLCNMLLVRDGSHLQFKYLSIYLREQECTLEHGREDQRQKERETRADSTLSAEPDVGLNLTTLRS